MRWSSSYRWSCIGISGCYGSWTTDVLVSSSSSQRLTVAAQSALLLTKMREYLTYRLGPGQGAGNKAAEAQEHESANGTGVNAEDIRQEAANIETGVTETTNVEAPPKPVVEETVNGPEDLGLPVPDGQGGVLLPPADEPEEPIEERLSFPDASREVNPGPEGPVPPAQDDTHVEAGPSTTGQLPPPPPNQSRHPYIDVLPEIGKLSREIVRNAEEKLAIAVGAYNTVCSD